MDSSGVPKMPCVSCSSWGPFSPGAPHPSPTQGPPQMTAADRARMVVVGTAGGQTSLHFIRFYSSHCVSRKHVRGHFQQQPISMCGNLFWSLPLTSQVDLGLPLDSSGLDSCPCPSISHGPGSVSSAQVSIPLRASHPRPILLIFDSTAPGQASLRAHGQ